MTVFHCDHCRHLLFFENVRCVSCDRRLAFLPDLGVLASLDPADGSGAFTTPIPRAAGRRYRLCANDTRYQVCNWAVPADDPHPLCSSCRLTRVIPNLSKPENVVWWYKLEAAKRRVVYTLRAVGLDVRNKFDDPAGGLAFEFKTDPDDPSLPPVLTGHAGGVVTVNLAEADDAERERRRVSLNEPFRTLLGHFRHEIGHHFWDRHVRDDPARLAAFRLLFGDDRADYAGALERHYAEGTPPDWYDRCVSAYATVHPWEDWAESFAHYLHMTDALETAAAGGVSIHPPRPDEPAADAIPNPFARPAPAFDALISGWHALAYLLNNLNRGLGLPDGYPFVLNGPAVEKLRFVHQTVTAVADRATMPTPPVPTGTLP